MQVAGRCSAAGCLPLAASPSIADRTLFAIAAIILAVYHALAGSVPEPFGQFNDCASIGLIRDFDERNDEPQPSTALASTSLICSTFRNLPSRSRGSSVLTAKLQKGVSALNNHHFLSSSKPSLS
jgi:hypothetical protein